MGSGIRKGSKKFAGQRTEGAKEKERFLGGFSC